MHRGNRLVYLAVCCLLALGTTMPIPTASSATPDSSIVAVPDPSALALAAESMQATRVNIGTLGILSDAPYILMRERGYLAEQGLDADYQVFDSGARMVPSLATGQLDLAPGSASVGLYNAVARGVNAKIVADWASSTPANPVNWIVVRQDLIDSGAVRDYGDLRGRKMAITARGTGVHAITGRIAERGGFPL